MLNCGQHPDTPVALFLRIQNPHVNNVAGRWSEQVPLAKKCIEAASKATKAAADCRRRPAEALEVGERVLDQIKHFGLRPGLKLAPWYLGPFPIIEVIEQHKLIFRVEFAPHAQHVSCLVAQEVPQRWS